MSNIIRDSSLIAVIPEGMNIVDEWCFKIGDIEHFTKSHCVFLNDKPIKDAIHDYFNEIFLTGVLASDIYIYEISDFDAIRLDPRPALIVRYACMKKSLL